MALTEDSPKIIDQVVDEGESQAFIPYADLGGEFREGPHLPARRPVLLLVADGLHAELQQGLYACALDRPAPFPSQQRGHAR